MAVEDVTKFFVGEKDVASAGTAEKIGDQSVEDTQSVVIRAKSANAGEVYIAPSQTGAQTSGSRFPLAAGASIELESIENLNQVWLDAANTNDGVEYLIG